MPKNYAMRSFEGKRVQFDSPRSFDQVLENLRKSVNTMAIKEIKKEVHFASMPFEELVQSKEKLKNFENFVKSQLGENEFMLFFEIDHGKWLPSFGIHRKAVRWIIGNPLFAITMIRHDIKAGLFVPVEIFLFENESGKGSTVMYDLPSSLMATEKSPQLLEAAQLLDRRLQTLISEVTGVSP